MKELSFEEFVKMCEDAGIGAPIEEMEQDFKVGSVVADVVDRLMQDLTDNPAYESALDGYEDLSTMLDSLKVEANKTIVDVEALRASVLGMATTAIRMVADVCYAPTRGN